MLGFLFTRGFGCQPMMFRSNPGLRDYCDGCQNWQFSVFRPARKVARRQACVAPGALGEYGAAAPTEAGRAENRRVEVKVLVNKGITGT